MKKEIVSNPDFLLAHNVRLAMHDDQNSSFTIIENGQLILDKLGIAYKGTAYPIIRFRIPNPPALSMDLVDHIDIFSDDDTIYRFIFDGIEKPVKLNLALEIIADLSDQSKINSI